METIEKMNYYGFVDDSFTEGPSGPLGRRFCRVDAKRLGDGLTLTLPMSATRRTFWGAGSGPRAFRSFWLPKLFAEVFDRHQEPDDDGANDGFGPYLLPGKTQVIIGDVPHR